MDLKDKTKDIITMIYIEYLCDTDEKKNIKKVLIKMKRNIKKN